MRPAGMTQRADRRTAAPRAGLGRRLDGHRRGFGVLRVTLASSVTTERTRTTRAYISVTAEARPPAGERTGRRPEDDDHRGARQVRSPARMSHYRGELMEEALTGEEADPTRCRIDEPAHHQHNLIAEPSEEGTARAERRTDDPGESRPEAQHETGPAAQALSQPAVPQCLSENWRNHAS